MGRKINGMLADGRFGGLIGAIFEIGLAATLLQERFNTPSSTAVL